MADNNSDSGRAPMLSFPSTFNSGGDGFVLRGANDATINAFNSKRDNSSDFSKAISRIKTRNLSLKDVRAQYYSENEMNISTYSSWMPMISLGDPNNGRDMNHKVYYEDPYHFPSDLLREMNLYKFMYRNSTTSIVGQINLGKGKDEQRRFYTLQTAMAPSLFNPKYNVQVIGMTYNVPLLNDQMNRGTHAIDNDVTDCSIRKLIELSNNEELGQQKYRLTDFIFCKDYGKISNNHLITLRKFSFPVGDIIGRPASPKYSTTNTGDPIGTDNMDDVAHLVTWFGTEDNKLDDIIKYSYQYTWKQLNANIQRLDSKEGDAARGPIGLFANMNPGYASHVNAGTAPGGGTFAGIFAGSRTASFNQTSSDAFERIRFVDNNKVYSPLQTIQDTHIPEGKLIFTNEFTLTFSYKLRAYENINPKSAFLDLLANIHECTYYRGKFWGGAQQIIGPKPNQAPYKKAYNFIDNAFDRLGGAIKSIINGDFNKEEIFGAISSIIPSGVQNFASTMIDKARNEGIGAAFQKGIQEFEELLGSNNIMQVFKGQLKNALGRPSFYAFDSLLSGGDVGVWHVTIGNPRNPIVSMGNLIMTNAEVKHMGPLGLDDFPTEIKVSCTLKPAMSRDLTGIQKMYTQGVSGIYYTKQYDKIETQLMFDNILGDIDPVVTGQRTDEHGNTFDETNSAIIDENAAKRQLELISGASVKDIDNSAQWGMVNSDLGMQIAQTGTSNLFKLQLSQDQQVPPTV